MKPLKPVPLSAEQVASVRSDAVIERGGPDFVPEVVGENCSVAIGRGERQIFRVDRPRIVVVERDLHAVGLRRLRTFLCVGKAVELDAHIVFVGRRRRCRDGQRDGKRVQPIDRQGAVFRAGLVDDDFGRDR